MTVNLVLYSVLCCLIPFVGFIMRQKLATASCCSMSWSAPRYDTIFPMSPGGRFGNYSMKFFRDMRDQSRPWSREGCSSPPVIFVPGHLGQFEQGRSLGAHGFRLGHVRGGDVRMDGAERLQAHYMQENFENFFKDHNDNDKNSDLTYLQNYDTYTLSFDQESSMLHSSTLSRQASFLIHSIDHALARHCKGRFDKVVLVGHSAGGVVARSIFNHPDYEKVFGGRPVVDTIVTLATPHEVRIYLYKL